MRILDKINDLYRLFRLDRLSKKLKIPYVSFYFEHEHIRDNKTIMRESFKLHSPNRNFWNCYAMTYMTTFSGPVVFGDGSLVMKRIDGAVINNFLYPGKVNSGLNYGFTNLDYSINANGIFFGTGAAAESFEGFELDSIISHGVAAGQLSYFPMIAYTRSFDAIQKKWEAQFNALAYNLSGGDITIREAALIRKLRYTGAVNDDFMHIRERLPVAVTLKTFDQYRGTFRIRYTHP